MNLKPLYITVPFESKDGIFQPGIEAPGRTKPDWCIADKFFKENPTINWVSSAAEKKRVFWLQAGEQSKCLTQVEQVLKWLVKNGAHRGQSIAVVGGGTVLDIGLFAASIYQRGLYKWSLPTTLLACVDAGIGGKNGINFMGLKNYIGTITQPNIVVSDYRVLETLKPLDVLSGWMEMTKHGLIGNSNLWLKMKRFETIPKPGLIHKLIEEAAAVKQRLVEADEQESGPRKILNFGHTIGHALESAAAEQKKELPHGIAVGLGMLVSLHWSASRSDNQILQNEMIEAAEIIKRWLILEASNQVMSTVESANLNTLWAIMKMDKKNNTQHVREVALTEIGHAAWNQPLSFEEFKTCWFGANSEH